MTHNRILQLLIIASLLFWQVASFAQLIEMPCSHDNSVAQMQEHKIHSQNTMARQDKPWQSNSGYGYGDDCQSSDCVTHCAVAIATIDNSQAPDTYPLSDTLFLTAVTFPTCGYRHVLYRPPVHLGQCSG